MSANIAQLRPAALERKGAVEAQLIRGTFVSRDLRERRSHRVPALSVPARGGGAEETYLEVAAGVTLIILTGRYFELAAGDEFVVRPGAGLVEDGQNGIAQVQRLADRVSAVSVPVGS